MNKSIRDSLALCYTDSDPEDIPEEIPEDEVIRDEDNFRNDDSEKEMFILEFERPKTSKFHTTCFEKIFSSSN